MILAQTFKFVEKANYEIGNLDFIKWIVSYSWNHGVQLYK